MVYKDSAGKEIHEGDSLKDWLEAKPDIERLRRIKGTKSPCQLKHF